MLRLRLCQVNYALAQVTKPGAACDQLGLADARIPVLGRREDPSILFAPAKFTLCISIEVSHLRRDADVPVNRSTQALRYADLWIRRHATSTTASTNSVPRRSRPAKPASAAMSVIDGPSR